MKNVANDSAVKVKRAQVEQPSLGAGQVKALKAKLGAGTVDAKHLRDAEQLTGDALTQVNGKGELGTVASSMMFVRDALTKAFPDDDAVSTKSGALDRGASMRANLKEALKELVGNKGRITGYMWDPSEHLVGSQPGFGTLLYTPLFLAMDLVAGPFVAAVDVLDGARHGAAWLAGDRLSETEKASRADVAKRAEENAAALEKLAQDPAVQRLMARSEQFMKHYHSRAPAYCFNLTGKCAGGNWDHATPARLVISPKGIQLHERNTYDTKGLRNPITGAVRHPEHIASIDIQALIVLIRKLDRGSGEG
jgi:hypothetical protein